MLGKIKGRRRRGYQRMRWLDSITDKMNVNLGKLREMVRDREAWCIRKLRRNSPNKVGCFLVWCPRCRTPLRTAGWRRWPGWPSKGMSTDRLSKAFREVLPTAGAEAVIEKRES